MAAKIAASRLRRPSWPYRLVVGIAASALLGAISFFVFSMAGMAAAAEGNTAAHHANLGLLMSVGFTVATALMLRLARESEDWRLLPWLPITSVDIMRRLMGQRFLFLVVPTAAALALPLWSVGLVPAVFLHMLLLATLFTLLALRESYLDTWWWGRFLFPVRWVVGKFLDSMKSPEISAAVGLLGERCSVAS